jgi:V8-like Glu-specific endopeptidase
MVLPGSKRYLAAVPITGLLIAGLLGAPAQANAPATHKADGNVGTTVAAGLTAAAAGNYWTKERMQSARPVPLPVVDPVTNAQLTAHAKPQGAAGHVAGAASKASAGTVAPLFDPGSTAAQWTGSNGTQPASTSGKIFFVGADGLNYVCSGSTINSGGKNLVFTAGHCVSNGAGAWYNIKPWIFVPAYNNGSAPYGQWTARALWTRTAWLNGANRAEDIGVGVMNTDPSGSGTKIVDRVGGQGIEWNYPLEQYIFQFGYPTRTPFNGATLQYCTGNTYNDSGFEGINCNMTEGASGGPWLDDFDGRFGRLDTVNSWVFWNGAGVRFKWNGPYFGNNARDLYNLVAAL